MEKIERMDQAMNDKVDDSFDMDEILLKYRNMTKDEMIDLLGDNYGPVLKERIEQGDIDFEEFTQICNEAIPDHPGQAKWIRNVIFNKLCKKEAFSMFERDPKKVEKYVKMEDLKEKAKNGKMTSSELKELCDITFGEDSEESKEIYNKMIEKGIVTKDEQDNSKSDYEKKIIDVKEKEKKEIAEQNKEKIGEQEKDEETSVIDETRHQPQFTDKSTSEPKMSEENEFKERLKAQTYTPKEIAQHDIDVMNNPQPVIEQPVMQPAFEGPVV